MDIREKYFRSELSYDEMKDILVANGWTTHWHPDNWIKRTWFKTMKNIDWAGVDTEHAFKMYLREKEGE